MARDYGGGKGMAEGEAGAIQAEEAEMRRHRQRHHRRKTVNIQPASQPGGSESETFRQHDVLTWLQLPAMNSLVNQLLPFPS